MLHQLTKAPFEPFTKAFLKHLTVKTIFLLALRSGKCISEIHACQNKHSAPTLDKSLRSDRSFCPVRAFAAIWTQPQAEQGASFVSFKKGFDKDISPATISSWIKQTVILCYELSDQGVLTLLQVKAHDVRVFTASKAFQSGASLKQILSPFHWKSHNTFTQFYMEDVAWADSEFIWTQ